MRRRENRKRETFVWQAVGAGYSLIFWSFFFLSKASLRSLSAQASQMVFVDGLPQIMHTCFFVGLTVSALPSSTF